MHIECILLTYEAWNIDNGQSAELNHGRQLKTDVISISNLAIFSSSMQQNKVQQNDCINTLTVSRVGQSPNSKYYKKY